MKSSQSKTERFFNFVLLWVARLALGVLAFAGGMWFLGGIDPWIAGSFSVVVTVYLLKEVL